MHEVDVRKIDELSFTTEHLLMHEVDVRSTDELSLTTEHLRLMKKRMKNGPKLADWKQDTERRFLEGFFFVFFCCRCFFLYLWLFFSVFSFLLAHNN